MNNAFLKITGALGLFLSIVWISAGNPNTGAPIIIVVSTPAMILLFSNIIISLVRIKGLSPVDWAFFISSIGVIIYLSVNN